MNTPNFVSKAINSVKNIPPEKILKGAMVAFGTGVGMVAGAWLTKDHSFDDIIEDVAGFAENVAE